MLEFFRQPIIAGRTIIITYTRRGMEYWNILVGESALEGKITKP
jgi:hypothetical protein